MPDGDFVSSTMHFRWRATFGGLRGSDTPGELAPRALKALTETLRQHGGIRAQAEYATIIAQRLRGELTSAEARQQARAVELAQARTPFSILVREAVDGVLTGSVSGTAVLQPALLTVAEAVCSRLVDAELFEKARASLVGARFPDHDAFDRFVADCKAHLAPGIARIGEHLHREPTGHGLRARPLRRRARKVATADLLNKSVL